MVQANDIHQAPLSFAYSLIEEAALISQALMRQNGTDLIYPVPMEGVVIEVGGGSLLV